MLTFNDLLKFPGQYAKRESAVQKVNINLAHIENNNNILIIGGLAKDYCPQINILNTENNKFDLTNPVKILCSCPSFKYEFASALIKVNSLLQEQYFLYNSLMHKPKKKNIYQLPSGCKHVIALARKIWANRNLKNFGLIPNIHLERQYMFATMQISMENWNPRDPFQSGLSRTEMHQKRKDLEKLKNVLK